MHHTIKASTQKSVYSRLLAQTNLVLVEVQTATDFSAKRKSER